MPLLRFGIFKAHIMNFVTKFPVDLSSEEWMQGQILKDYTKLLEAQQTAKVPN